MTISPPLALPKTADNAAILQVATMINAEIEGGYVKRLNNGSGHIAAGAKTFS